MIRSGQTLPALVLTASVLAFSGAALAQSSLGIGNSEATLPSTGMFAGILNWVNAQQQGFYRTLTGALKTMKQDGSGTWVLVGLSFAYGVFHAAGPGHGKAVISSYMLANEVALKRGVVLSLLSALLQGLTAILVMGAVFLALRGSSVSMTDATWFLELASYALITGFGLWLLWRKAGVRLVSRVRAKPAHSLSAASVAHDHVHHHHGHDHAHHDHNHDHDHDHHHHHHVEGEVCPECGHAHMPDPKLLSEREFSWRSAWTAVAAVGLRPCTGALIVLSFAFLNSLWVAGVLSVLAMSIGTAITVSILAILAVTAKNWAVLIAGEGPRRETIHVGIEIAGAALVFLLGLTLLSASLTT
ncbi:MAG: nickel/cobalt transporter [Rhizobiaceae bacterium]|nr:nickel/cobalt transporter [Rhizobiaceae bacterium]